MTDEKMIKEMAKIVGWHCNEKSMDYCDTVDDCDKCLAIDLYNAGYRKLPENAVVLTIEEYKMVLETQKHLEKKYSDMRDELNLCKNENEIIKQNYIQLKQDNDQARKETAREILKKGNEYLMQSTDKACAFACFLGIMEHDYGVEVEECI